MKGIGTLITVIVVVILLLILLCMGYVKAPPDMAFIISGIKKKSKVVIGKASIRIPFFERLDKLNLRLIPIDVKTSNAVPTADYININVDATVNVKISNQPDKLRLAAENFLNKNTEYIANVAREVLEGNVREIVGRMRLEEMVSDRQKFAELVKENAEPDLAAMGLDIISFNVQNFVDGNDVIENLGIDNIVKIKKAAAIARAESERDIKVAQAAADKDSNDAAVAAQTEIAKKQNELAIKKSELQMEADTKKAMADAAYEIQKEEQRKTIENSCKYIRTHLGSPLSISELARRVGYTEYYFSHKFKKEVGCSVTDFIIKEKISQAKLMLEGTNDTIQSISDALSFSNRSYFYTCFQKLTGISPSEYRKRNGKL